MIEREIQKLQRRADVLEAREGALEAFFADTATAASDDIRVTVPGFDDGEHLFGPVVWAPIEGVYPQAGDQALVMESDQGRWWVLTWVPTGEADPMEFMIADGDLYVSE